ncbi:MAG: hypothetical protein WBU92_05895 [Candidatus Dormiibacterota bacterium]
MSEGGAGPIRLRPQSWVAGSLGLGPLRWPLRELALGLALYSAASLPVAIAEGQNWWPPVSFEWRAGGGPAGLLQFLDQGPIGRYLLFWALGSVLLATGALAGIWGGLLCWWRIGWARGLLALGLAVAMLGHLAGVPQALSQGQIFPHQAVGQAVAQALMSALWSLFLLVLVLTAVGRSSAAGSPVQEDWGGPPAARLGLVLALYGGIQLASALFWVAPAFQDAVGAPPIAYLPLQIAYQGLALGSAAVVLSGGAAMWVGRGWGPPLAAWGWALTIVQALMLAVASWVSLRPGQAPAAVMAPSLFTLVIAIGALWALAWTRSARRGLPLA